MLKLRSRGETMKKRNEKKREMELKKARKIKTGILKKSLSNFKETF